MIAGITLYNALSPLVDGRVYPSLITEHGDPTTPYIIYQIVSSVPETTIDGTTGHEWVRAQIDVYDDDLYQCTLLANRVVNAINDALQTSDYGGQQQLYDTENNLHRQLIEYHFWQTTPTE